MRDYDDFANKYLVPEEKAVIVGRFGKPQDLPLEQTYIKGLAFPRKFTGLTLRPRVGIVVPPGSDLPEVNRLEQARMVSDPPKRGSAWKVNTAGSLLSTIFIAEGLSLVTQDVTEHVADIALRRRPKLTNTRSKYNGAYARDAVTIASANVEVVHDLTKTARETDLSATLIEIDVSSLGSLVADCKQIIMDSRKQMNFHKTEQYLTRMIEATRRMCRRSPNLLRMSTRYYVANSNNTRYGFDGEYIFRTFTTSKGIQAIIMTYASYYGAVNPSAFGVQQGTQTIIRHQFMQMLVVLLSLLNDDDLRTRSEYLEQTFGLIPKRGDMELLFLKVMPLTSMNSRVFLQALIPTVDVWKVPERGLRNEPWVWMQFVKRLAKKGYLILGSVEELGHSNESWIPNWPDRGESRCWSTSVNIYRLKRIAVRASARSFSQSCLEP